MSMILRKQSMFPVALVAALLIGGCTEPAARNRVEGPALVAAIGVGEPTTADAQRLVPLQGALNVRSLAGLQGAHGPVPAASFIRAAEMNRITVEDGAVLKASGVRLFLDLRTAEEADKAPDVLAGRPDARYQRISLLGSERIDLSQLPDSLGELYVRALADSQAQFRQVFQAMAAERYGTVLFHCTAGKDRTGMIAAMLLSLAGVPRQQIVHNYAISAHYLQPMMSQSRQMAEMVQANPKVAALMGSPPEAMEQFLDALDSRGGARAYLRSIGLSDTEIGNLMVRLGQGAHH